ncbi:hypothetical protein E2562_038482 [Oryza meyeriana var. granulata]|uniref:Uncharacterized protein n=1 Tax=Oryza meyeriana var. granulata TaxID=110450 RepID=A0A6G1C145_9ORYZ|nr:hypothetical protein E2562_038482 [Oryza meyeriana var. granulata]
MVFPGERRLGSSGGVSRCRLDLLFVSKWRPRSSGAAATQVSEGGGDRSFRKQLRTESLVAVATRVSEGSGDRSLRGRQLPGYLWAAATWVFGCGGDQRSSPAGPCFGSQRISFL